MKIKSLLINKTENKCFHCEVNGKYIDNEIQYIDNDVEVTIKIMDEVLVIRRHCLEYTIEINLSLNQSLVGKYMVKQLGELSLRSEANKMEIKPNLITCEYDLILDEQERINFEFILEYSEE